MCKTSVGLFDTRKLIHSFTHRLYIIFNIFNLLVIWTLQSGLQFVG